MSNTETKSQIEFYISKGEQNLGPWTVEQVAERVVRSELSITDFYYDDARASWVSLMELEVLKEPLRAATAAMARTQAPPPKAPPPPMKAAAPASQNVAPAQVAQPASAPQPGPMPSAQSIVQATVEAATPPATPGPQLQPAALAAVQAAAAVLTASMTPAQARAANENSAAKIVANGLPPSLDIDFPGMKREEAGEWFVQKGAHRYGPLNYMGLVRALQEKTVYDFDFVWKEGMDTWIRIAEHKDFHPDRIRELAAQLVAQKPDGAGPFFRRQFPRLPFQSEIIVHDDRSVWMGESFEAGMGGSGVLIENSTLAPGQVIRLHFAPCDGLPAFNALGEIVGKRFSKEIRGNHTPVRYAVRFLKLDGSAEPQVREYFNTKVAA